MERCQTKEYKVGDLVIFTDEGNHPFGFEGVGRIMEIADLITMYNRPGYIITVDGKKIGWPYWDEDLNPAFVRNNREAKRLLIRR